MKIRKMTAVAALLMIALPIASTAFAHDRDDDHERGRPAHGWRDDGHADRHGDRGYHHERRWHDHGRYRHGRGDGYYPRRDWDDHRATVVLPFPPLPPLPVLVVPKQHKGHIVLRPGY